VGNLLDVGLEVTFM